MGISLEIKQCLVCEAVRPEPGGKATIMGFYGIAPDVEILFPQLPISISLMLLMIGTGGDGKPHSGKLTMVSPDGKEIAQADLDSVQTNPNGKAILGVGFNVLTIQAPGVHRIKLLLDGRETYSTEVRFTRNADAYKAAFAPPEHTAAT